MSKQNYPACLAHVLKWEGGYVDHPADPGGATNYGITLATLSAHRGHQVSRDEVKRLSAQEAGAIYRTGYWKPVKGDKLPAGLDLVTFDGGVNSGPSRGVRWLQKGLGVTVDGKIGTKTLAAAERAAAGTQYVRIIQRACAARMGFLQDLRNWATFGRGWSRRVADTEAAAVAMATRSPARLETEATRAETTAKTQKTAAGGSLVGGAGAQGLADLPNWAAIGLIAAAVALAIILLARAAHNGARRAAYVQNAKEITHG